MLNSDMPMNILSYLRKKVPYSFCLTPRHLLWPSIMGLKSLVTPSDNNFGLHSSPIFK